MVVCALCCAVQHFAHCWVHSGSRLCSATFCTFLHGLGYSATWVGTYSQLPSLRESPQNRDRKSTACPQETLLWGDLGVWGTSAGGPAHLPPAQHVEVQVVHRLSTVLPVVDDCREKSKDQGGECHPWGDTRGERSTHPAGSRQTAPLPAPCALPPPSGVPGAVGAEPGAQPRVPHPTAALGSHPRSPARPADPRGSAEGWGAWGSLGSGRAPAGLRRGTPGTEGGRAG